MQSLDFRPSDFDRTVQMLFKNFIFINKNKNIILKYEPSNLNQMVVNH
jgi:hypothetical protein